MKFNPLAVTFVVVVVCLTISQTVFGQRPANDAGAKLSEPSSVKTDLYPADADAKGEIAEALKRATTERKRVLLIFGANWCYDCHVLDQALHDGEAGKLVSQNFLLVHVDIGEGEKNPDLLKTYKIPLDKGVPAVAVLESNGRLLYGSGDGEFEAWLDVVADAVAHPDTQGVPSHEEFPREVVVRAERDLAAAGAVRYAALRDGVIAGGASFRIAEGVAQLTGAATAPAHRRRGVQTALLSARLADAAAAGCDIAVVTTQPGSKSQQNVQRRGFDLLYARAVLVKQTRSSPSRPTSSCPSSSPGNAG